MGWQDYLAAAHDGLRKVEETQAEVISQAAERIASAIQNGRKIFSFGSGHSFMLTEEVVYRTGGLMLINPIQPYALGLDVRPLPMTSQIERLEGYGSLLFRHSGAEEGDVLLMASTSGRNPVPIDMALAARDQGVYVIAITSLAYSRSVNSRHSSGKRLFEVADLVIDNCAPAGDALVHVEGFPQAIGPLSSLTGVAIVNSIVCQVAENLLKAGVVPPIFISANMEGGDEHNRRMLAKYKDRILYL